MADFCAATSSEAERTGYVPIAPGGAEVYRGDHPKIPPVDPRDVKHARPVVPRPAPVTAKTATERGS